MHSSRNGAACISGVYEKSSNLEISVFFLIVWFPQVPYPGDWVNWMVVQSYGLSTCTTFIEATQISSRNENNTDLVLSGEFLGAPVSPSSRVPKCGRWARECAVGVVFPELSRINCLSNRVEVEICSLRGFKSASILCPISSCEISSLSGFFSWALDWKDALVMFSMFTDILGCKVCSYVLPLLRLLLLWEKLMKVMETWIYELCWESYLLQS